MRTKLDMKTHKKCKIQQTHSIWVKSSTEIEKTIIVKTKNFLTSNKAE